MVNTPTQREPLDAVSPLGSLKLHDGDADWGLIRRIRMNSRPRSERHSKPQRASGSGRTPEATVPSCTKADDVFSPCRPRNL
eukprot:4695771-Pleurochrysis_carterae.AAC.1